jgi:hypothetical protein
MIKVLIQRQQGSLPDYSGYDGPVFVDGATSINMLAGVPVASLDLVQLIVVASLTHMD